MKKTLILILIASMLMVGCNKNIDNDIVESVADINEASEIVAETTIPESTVTETNEITTNEKPHFEHDWQSLYYDELTKYIDKRPPMFNIYDLDGDGTPELLLSAYCVMYLFINDRLMGVLNAKPLPLRFFLSMRCFEKRFFSLALFQTPNINLV